VTQRTVARLSEQLRRFIDDKAFLENRRIMGILRDIEASALAVRGHVPDGPFMELDEPAPDIRLVMERPLFSPSAKPTLDGKLPDEGEENVPTDALFDQVYVDKTRLQGRIRQALQTRDQIALADIVAVDPLEQGLAEVIAYLSIAADDPANLIDDRRTQTVRWRDEAGVERQATLPLVIFNRLQNTPASGHAA
jgi:hypothetical protein